MIGCGIQGGIYKDDQGIKVFFYIFRRHKKRIERLYFLKRYKPEITKGPCEDDPTVLTEKPTGRIFDVEDIINGVEFEKPLEPEDI